MKKYTNSKAFRVALEQRLKNHAATQSLDLQELRRKVAFERFLNRLFAEGSRSPWLLKGGYAMELRLEISRATKDIDLLLLSDSFSNELWQNNGNEVLDFLRIGLARNLDDYFEFLVGPSMMDLENAPDGGARFPVHSKVAGRTFIKFHVDISTGDNSKSRQENLSGEDWLAFAGIPTQQFASISEEQQFSEKLHAYTMPRGERLNSRFRDLIDMSLLIEKNGMNSSELRVCIDKTFKNRELHPLPKVLQEPPEFWKEPFEKMAEQCHLEPNIQKQFVKVRDFTDSVLRNINDG